MTTNRRQQQTTAQGADNLVDILDAASKDGFGVQLVAAEDGSVRCGECGATNPASAFSIQRAYRLEGASDPADMMIVALGNCPTCHRGGALTLGFGPNASDADAAVLPDLDLSHTQP